MTEIQKLRVGKKIFLNSRIEVSENYFQIAQNDERTASILESQKLYNQAAYFLIQAMEKYVKSHIATKINVLNKYFADEIGKTMGHSLNRSLELLLKVYSGNNKTLFEQMNQQLQVHVIKNLNFRFLNNSLRYSMYDERYNNYSVLLLNQYDCAELRKILESLKNYLNDLSRLR
ncbi:MAG: hypothetical protein IJ575_04405 [Selenomonadaceae bacterium]|nr:hypothetical protein [Selenomonadaceae bacterium]